MRKCTHCGKELLDVYDVCPEDGSPLENAVDQQKQAFDGIGMLEISPYANTLLAFSKIFGCICIFAGIVLAIPLIKDRNNREFTDEEIILGAVGMLFFFGGIASAAGIESLVKRRLYHLGDWYKQLEVGATTEKHDAAREAANWLLRLTATDLLTSKLKAKAHLYLGYYQATELGAGHWEPSIALLNEILEKESDNAVFRLDRGQAYHKIGKYDEALRDLNIAVADTERPNVRAHSLRISCLTAMNRLDEAKSAVANFETLRSKFPDGNAITEAIAAHKAEINAKTEGK